MISCTIQSCFYVPLVKVLGPEVILANEVESDRVLPELFTVA